LTAFAGGALYCASKHAVLGMTRGAALDYAQSGLRINAINPGGVNTPMVDEFIELSGGDPAVMEPIAAAHPMGRLATAEEIAAGVLWLCSQQASFVSGQPLVIDGGFTAA
jgi:NAD(P)-dependent dehydrogenase (short-subunit alcohol dehydrogenase family)